MTTISPSILSADFSHLGADCRMVLDAGAQMLHYDVMDGHFVPNISFGVPVLKSLHKALPDAFYDVHLMITTPSSTPRLLPRPVPACSTSTSSATTTSRRPSTPSRLRAARWA